jgi:hypothetical protein
VFDLEDRSERELVYVRLLLALQLLARFEAFEAVDVDGWGIRLSSTAAGGAHSCL